ncbi:HEPN domain-containing protein [Thermodesulfovibrio yellowstonii]|uniref:HEPN domain-containing protein n=1 Tax=Thermodesulfovibrio yellowstonii TaxID=28262 RepID=UPI0024B33737|nr:HEPN domain-containing protein [Thermodesulfovibrio yellowstonii]MDI6865617.1 HEPN domain-containing protein [Thermodesulfovibrio yellowstonii]
MVERISKKEALIRAKDEFKRAEEELKAANILQEKEFYYKSIVSAYYTVYHAAKALLLIKCVDPKTHEGVERMFGLYYIKTGDFDTKIGKVIGRLRKMREEADYYPEIPFDRDDSKEAIVLAREFLEKAKNIIKI